MNKRWFLCPACNKKLCKCTNNAQGVYIECKRCKREVEIKNIK
jgi:transcription elongation factor Elf1